MEALMSSAHIIGIAFAVIAGLILLRMGMEFQEFTSTFLEDIGK
jgi:hypothetical protein